jgi:hypothetical protein
MLVGVDDGELPVGISRVTAQGTAGHHSGGQHLWSIWIPAVASTGRSRPKCRHHRPKFAQEHERACSVPAQSSEAHSYIKMTAACPVRGFEFVTCDDETLTL